jgi:hypothetical protein
VEIKPRKHGFETSNYSNFKIAENPPKILKGIPLVLMPIVLVF